jgi:1-deoxy-D-xylulose-5-phosphate synthase
MNDAAERYRLLDGVDSPADLRRLPIAKLPALAREMRGFLLKQVAAHGGHFAAGLGTVELAVAAHYVFDTPNDLLVWDGGHQAYPHKMLTGRRGHLHTTREPGGLQPFPQCAESEYDAFGVGHAGTSVSAALGLCIAAARRNEPRQVVAIIGDAALAAGMAFEALNHAGSLPADLLIILNDNDPVLSRSMGALSGHLARVLSGRAYAQLRESGKKVLRPMPTVLELARRSELHLKGMVLPGTLYEELGFNYVGPMDGHDVKTLVATLRNLKQRRGPQFLHVVTRRGKGHSPAASRSIKWRGTALPGNASARPSKGATASLSYTQVFGQWLCDMARADPRIIAITPAMREDSGLLEFARRFPDRCFDVGMAQQHAVTFAAGLAAEGLKPVVAIPSTFLQRAYDQLIHDVALQKLPVIFAVDRAGLVGGDGATHQGSYDLSYLRCIPNMTIMAPADENECRQMLYTASTLSGPVVVRYPRGNGPGVVVAARMSALPVGRAQVCREGGGGVALLVFGALVDSTARTAERLDATLVNMRFIKPLDRELVRAVAAGHRALVTIEENTVAGGAGSAVAETLASSGVQIPLLQLGIPDRFIEHGSRESCLAAARLDAQSLAASIERWWTRQNPERVRSAGAAQ